MGARRVQAVSIGAAAVAEPEAATRGDEITKSRDRDGCG
jgi:hypothetical protein